jgi:GNAT superfamily N-acetyltransferase
MSASSPAVATRRMRRDELDAARGVWREANIARGAPHGVERTARVGAKLAEADALPYVALRDGIVGMALAEPGRHDRGAGELDPSLLHLSMLFVTPAAQRTGVGQALLEHVLGEADVEGYARVGVWTGAANAPARALYERAGLTLTGLSDDRGWRTQVQYLIVLGGVR